MINKLNSIINAVRFKKTIEPFIDIDIPYVHIKGEALSVQAYGNCNQRVYSDIDILLDRKNVEVIEKIIIENNFTTIPYTRQERIMLMSHSHQIPPYYKKELSVSLYLDINFDIFWGEYEGKKVDINNFISECIYINIYGFNVRTLSPIKAFIQLILHHYKEMNSIFHLATHNSINYTMFKDVYNLLINNIEYISIDKLYEISSEYEIIPYVYYVLYYTNLIYNDNILNKYIKSFATSDGKMLLDYFGLSSNEKKLWRYDFEKRLHSSNLYDLIKYDLNDKDIEKLNRNKKIFL